VLPHEVDKIKKEAKEKGIKDEAKIAQMIDLYGVKKLVKVGVFWKAGEPQPPMVGPDLFTLDTYPNLSPLERDIVRLQIWSWSRGRGYDSPLLTAKEMDELKEKMKAKGAFDAKKFRDLLMARAARREDHRELQKMYEEAK